MPDDSEDIYVPTGPNDLDQESNLQELRSLQIESKESIDKSKTVPSDSYRPFTAGNLEDPIILNLNYKDVFPELNLEELPPQIKYKLPISEHYDPEGNMVKQREVYDKKIITNYEKIKKLAKEHKDDVLNKEMDLKEEVCDRSVFAIKDMSKEHKHFNILEEETKLRKIKQTAVHVIEDSLSKAVTVANELKIKSDVKLSKSLQYEENKNTSKPQKQSMQTEKKAFKQSSKEEVKSETKKVSFKDDYQVHETEKSSDETSKREVRVADEIKKFETFDILMDSKLNAEERKLLTQQDIEEAIEAGTVRQRTGMFKTDSERIMTNKLEKKILRPVRSDLKINVELAKQKAYNIGFQIIPRIRNAAQYSRQSSLILKRFFLQMTKVMISLFKCIPINKRYIHTKPTEFHDGNIESREYDQKKEDYDEAFRSDTSVDEHIEIRKPKLSGAKIAQIEGLKPAELTDKMNIVISEFLRKSGQEEIIEEKELHRRQTSSFINERTTKDKFKSDHSFRENNFHKSQARDEFPNDTSFREKTFFKSQAGDDILNGSNFRDKAFDTKKMFEETYESKTKSYEIREIKEEKRHTESKTSKFNAKVPAYETESTSRDDVTVPLTYIAIVEAHVYTNKNAIFEEQMRRMSESMKHSDFTESGIIYYRCEVSVFYRHFREPSLPPTVVIESIEEIPSEQVFEGEKQEILQTRSTVYEDTAKKLAVQKISEVIEPLLKIKEVRSVNIKQAYPAIERPLKLISEHTSVTMEKEESILQESKLLKDLSRVTIETPLKSVVETSEIKEEENRGIVEILETDKHMSRPIKEPTAKSIAETTEIFIEEETVGMVVVPQPIAQLPQPVKVERPIKSVAEISQVIVDEANVEILDVSETISATPRYTIADNLRSIAETMIEIIAEPESECIKDVLKVTGGKVKVGVDEIIASEVFEVFPEEPVYEEVVQTETTRRQSEVFMEKSVLVLPEITLTSTEEPICEELVVSKVLRKEAKIDVDVKVVAEITEVTLNEKEQDGFEVMKITEKEPGALKEETVLSVGETETILPFEPPAEPFDLSKFICHEASLTIEESKATETTIIQVEEPKEKDVDLIKLMKKHTQACIENKILAAAETFSVLPEEPKVTFEINENLKQQAKVKVMELNTATVLSVSIEEPKQQTVEIPKVSDKEPNTAMEASLLTVAENTIIFPEGPHHGYLEIPNIETKRPNTLIEGGLILAETIEVSPASPESGFNLTETINQQAYINIEESKAITTTLVHLEEPKEEKLDVLQFEERKPQALLQDTSLTVPTTAEILPEGPRDENLITPKPVEEKADIDIEELKTASVTVVSVEEPKNENIENFTYKEKESESLLEKPVLNVAEKFTTVPEGPLYDKFEPPTITSDKANIIFEEIKPLMISIVMPNEPREKAVDVPQVKNIKPQSLIDHFLPVVETISVVPEESKIETYVVSKTKDEQANINIEICETAETTMVTTGEPKEHNFEVPIYEIKKPITLTETCVFTVPEIMEIIPDEPKDSFTVASVISEQADVKIGELKGTKTTIIFPEEPKEENFESPIFEAKQQQSVLEAVHLTAAETTLILSEESSASFGVTKTTSQLANIKLIEQKVAEALITVPLESKQDVIIAQITEKTPQTLLESPILTAAENSVIVYEEKVAELRETIKPVGQKASVYLEGLKVAESIILFLEEPTPDNIEVLRLDKKEPRPTFVDKYFALAEIEFILPNEAETEFTVFSKTIHKQGKLTYEAYLPVIQTEIIVYEDAASYVSISKLITNQAKVLIVETTAIAVANITSVTVTVAKEEIVEVSKYIVELAEEHAKKEAGLKIKVDFEDVDLSSTSSTISSAPSSPFIQEYVFGIATGHEYRVQSPQETSLDIKQPTKELYGVNSADTSYTLTFEAAYEDEKEVLQMEEFSDVIKNKQFWISDVKTIETVESSDARMQLTNVSMGVLGDARKSQSKSIYVQGAVVENKSRSPSFDTSVDFEVSLQSSEQSKARETQISDVQVAAIFDLKSRSEASFKTIQDVESQAKVNIKSKSAKAYSAQSVDVAYGLTIENELEITGQSMEFGIEASQDTKIAKSSIRQVKNGAKGVVLESSEIGKQARCIQEAERNHESRSISKESFAAMDGSLESSRISEANYLAMEGKLQSSKVSKASSASTKAYLESSRVYGETEKGQISKVSSAGKKTKLESSSVSEVGSSYMKMEASLESRSISKGICAAIEASSASETNYSSKQASIESKSSSAIEMDASQKISTQKGLTETTEVGTTMDEHHKLSLEIDLSVTRHSVTNGVKSPSPEDIPATPLRDVYLFKLHTPAPQETTFIPRDCSFTPESVHEEPIVPVKGMIPHIDSKIVRVLYSPPLDTPPSSPWSKIEPVFTKPGLKGGSDTPEFTKEEILEIGRKSALLASAIDKTIRSIEEYKESVGISDKKETCDTEDEGKLYDNGTTSEKCIENKGVKRLDTEEKKTKPNTFDQLTELDVTRKDNKTSRKRMQILSRFSRI